MADPVFNPDRSGSRSVWPPLLALGFAMSELGILVGTLGITVAGLIIFGVSSAGLAGDSGLLRSPVRGIHIVGTLFVVVGATVILYRVPLTDVGAIATWFPADGVAKRGVAMFVAGLSLFPLTIAGRNVIDR